MICTCILFGLKLKSVTPSTPEVITLKEYIRDYASPATREKGEAMIRRLLADVPNERVRSKAGEYICKIDNGERDFRF